MVGRRLLLEHLVEDGVYRSQFETGTSNGGLTAHPGGDRWRWESYLFGGAYDAVPPQQRPKYGSLNHRQRPAGGSVRFGSAHFRLSAHVLERATFCYPDSYLQPIAFGTAQHMPLIALAQRDEAAGTVDVLDDYIEAHVHGPVHLERDVEAVVLDPCYRGTPVEAAAVHLPMSVEWHHGFCLDVKELAEHAEYRGQRIVDLGRRVAREVGSDDRLDARTIGEAVRLERWDHQDLKKLWHCTARFGGPVS